MIKNKVEEKKTFKDLFNEKDTIKENNLINYDKYTEIKVFPIPEKKKKRKDIVKWLTSELYDGYDRNYFLHLMFNEMVDILNEKEFYYEKEKKNEVFTEFINWCYFNSYDD